MESMIQTEGRSHCLLLPSTEAGGWPFRVQTVSVHYQQHDFCQTPLKATQITKHLLLLHYSANSIVRAFQTLKFRLEKLESLSPLNCLLHYSMSQLAWE